MPCVTGLLGIPSPVSIVVGVFSLGGMVFLWRDVAWRVKGGNRSVGSLLTQYVAIRVVGWLGKRQRERLEADTRDIRKAQEETLLKRLRKNALTCYGRLYDFSSITGNVWPNQSMYIKPGNLSGKCVQVMFFSLSLAEDTLTKQNKPL